MFVCRGETAVASLLSDEPHNLCSLGIEDYDADSESEVLEVLTDTEEVGSEVVVEREVIDFALDRCGGLCAVIDKPRAVANLGIEHLTGGECLVRFDQVYDVERHLVCRAPWHIAVGVGEDCRCNLAILLEHWLRLGERHRGACVWQCLYRRIFEGVHIVKCE